jgi:hypothetical protein
VRRLRRHFRPILRPRASLREKGTLASTEDPGSGARDRDLRKKTGRSIRCQARIRPFEKSPNRFRAFESGRAPALHASRVSHDPCLQDLSLRFAHSRRMRPLSVGRVWRLSSSDGSLLASFRHYVKKLLQKVSQKACAGACRVGLLTSAIAGLIRRLARHKSRRKESLSPPARPPFACLR